MLQRPSIAAVLAALPACLDATPGAAVGDASGPSATDTAATSATTTSAPDTAATTTSTPDTSTTTAPDTSGACDPAGTMCGLGNRCCEGLFCTGGPYHYGECTPPQPIGTPCGAHGECTSGHCQEGVCASPGCYVVGTMCDDHAACCTGYCDTQDYGPTSCQARRPAGQWCAEDRHCDTGLCDAGACVGGCQAEGEGCLWDNDCCAGTFCDDLSGAGDRACAPLRDVGGACGWDGHCRSGSCSDAGVCVADGCLALEADCFSDLECCAGACSYDATSYARGHCFTPQPAGAACLRDAWCASQRCVEGLCAP